MRKYWVHYTYAKGKKHVRAIMIGSSHREIMTRVRKIRRDAVIVSILDVAMIDSKTILTTMGA